MLPFFWMISGLQSQGGLFSFCPLLFGNYSKNIIIGNERWSKNTKFHRPARHLALQIGQIFTLLAAFQEMKIRRNCNNSGIWNKLCILCPIPGALLAGKMPHCFLRSVTSLTSVFHKRAKSDGCCRRLAKTELEKLLQQEFGNALEVRTVTLLAHILWYLGLSSWLQWYYSLLPSSYLSSYFFSGFFKFLFLCFVT